MFASYKAPFSALYPVGGEATLEVRGRKGYSDERTQRLLIGLHGAGGVPTVFDEADIAGTLGVPLGPIVETGRYGLLSIDAGGSETWIDDAALAAIDTAVAWAQGPSGWASPTAKIGLVGYSMGGGLATRYAQLHPDLVAGVVVFAPAVNLDIQYADPRFTALIDAAYGGSYATNGASHNPQLYAATMTTPWRGYSAIDDSVVPNSEPHAFYDALTVQKRVMIDLPGGNHTNFWQYVDPQRWLRWLDSLAW